MAPDRSNALLKCGYEQLKSGDAASATDNLETFVHTYPRHRAIAQAKSALIAARVADAANKKMSIPPPLSGNNPGPIR
ncbi:MAG: hypothetical protein ACRDSK_07235 [Actinophytocola sp.]|uniref:hypothetical protein n=1 Tax=Actinophytocola sp. TaxID=1872138 RepID=UPI003D6B2C73